jgi:hypothetical protein
VKIRQRLAGVGAAPASAVGALAMAGLMMSWAATAAAERRHEAAAAAAVDAFVLQVRILTVAGSHTAAGQMQQQ